MEEKEGHGRGPGPIRRERARGILGDVLPELPGVVYRCRNDRDWTMLGLTANVEELTGYPAEELVESRGIPFGDLIHPDDRERVWSEVQEAVRVGEPFRLTYRIETRAGERRWILEQGRAVEDEGETVLAGYIQDVTGPLARRLDASRSDLRRERRRADRLRLLQRVTARINGEREPEAALRSTLPELCRSLGFAVGHVWAADPDDPDGVRDTGIWHVGAEGEELQSPQEASAVGSRRPGEGVAARAIRSGGAVWIDDVRDEPDVLPVDDDPQIPARSGVVVPVVSGERTPAVLELFDTEPRPREPEVEALLEQVGVQLGRVWERAEAVRDREARERRFRQIVENIEAGFWLTTPERELLYRNTGFEELTGVDGTPGSWREYLERIHPGDRERMKALYRREDRAPYEVEYRIVRPDGEVRWLRQKAFPIHDDEGNVQRIGGLTYDVTEEHEAHERLRRTTQMLQQTLRSLREAVLVVGGEGSPRKIRMANEAAERVFGYPREELVGATTEKLHVDRASFERFARVGERALREEGVYRGEFPLRRKDGTVFHAEQTVALLDPEAGLEGGVVSVCRDVSERKEAVRRLRESEERFRQLAERIDSVFWISSPDKGEMEYVSPAYQDLWGRRPDHLYDNPGAWIEQIHPEDRERVVEVLPRQFEGDYDEEYRIVRPDGEVRWVWDRAFPVEDEDGEVHRLIGIAEDITERKEVAEELRRAERHFRALIESSADVIAVLDEELVTRYVSPSAEDVLGYTPEEIVGSSGRIRVHPDDRERAMEQLRKLLDEPGETLVQSHRMISKDGSIRHVESTARNLLDDPAVEGIVVNLRDVSERRALESQLRQAQKMEAVGRLAGGIAHDFNNLLTVIRSQSDLLLLDLEEESELSEEVRVIREASDRAARLTGQLLAFSREQVLRPRVVDLNEVVEGMRDLLARVLGEDVAVEMALEEDLPAIRVDPGQLEQVVLNLAVNARDAMPRGGTLTLTTESERVDPGEAASLPGLDVGRYVRLSVSDTGVGMDRKTLSRVFEPFFTTKEGTEGTGLGLAVSYGIVKQSGGAIHAESDPGEGATFHVRFPRVDAEPGEVRTGTGSLEGSGGLEGRILVVEDDAHVRRATRRILERTGFEVETAESGQAALEILAGGGPLPDLVLTDLVLPGIGGRELLERTRARHPGLSVVVMSGYDRDSPGSRSELPDDVAFVQKPFTPEELVNTLRRELVGA